jgi:branched-chain amino acid aminotransferase
MRVVEGRILLAGFHFERLFQGLRLLKFELPGGYTATKPKGEWGEELAAKLHAEILKLCEKNAHSRAARVRLVVFRGEGGLYDPRDHFPNYVIETWPLPSGSGGYNQNGLLIDVYPEGRKACDPLANLKSNNFLLYIMAALHAKEQRLNDCLVLNGHGRIADSTIANVFYVSKGKIYTPPLSEGCVAGVMRHWLLETLPGAGFEVREKETRPEDLEEAEELFLTNAIRGLNWVQSFRSAAYGQEIGRAVYEAAIKTIG